MKFIQKPTTPARTLVQLIAQYVSRAGHLPSDRHSVRCIVCGEPSVSLRSVDNPRLQVVDRPILRSSRLEAIAMSQNPQTQTLFVLELAVQGNAPSLRAVGFDRERLKGLGNVIAGAAPESSGYTLTELHERDGLWLSEGMLGIVESAGASSP